MSRRNRKDDYIPIKIEGWNGKFVYDKDPNKTTIPKAAALQQQQSNTQNFYGFCTEPTRLPPKWDGTFSGPVTTIRTIPERNQSSFDNFYGFNTEPEILPTTWSGKFQSDPTNVRIKPERNESSATEYYGSDNRPTILPPQWDGSFQASGSQQNEQ